MKKITLLPLALTFAANAAMAANSVDLRVTGTITPEACDVSLSGGGNFDVGTISSTSLKQTQYTILGQTISIAPQNLDIVCTGPTQVAFKVIDNRSSSVILPSYASSDASRYAMGLGFDAANNPIGYYDLNIIIGQSGADGIVGEVKTSTDGGTTWGPYRNGAQSLASYSVYPEIYAIDGPGTAGTPPNPITSAWGRLQVNPSIQPTNNLDTSQDINLDGSATIELVYL